MKTNIITDIFKQDDKYQVLMSNDTEAFYVGKPFTTYDEAEVYENSLIKFLNPDLNIPNIPKAMFKYRIIEKQYDASTKRASDFIPQYGKVTYHDGDERSSQIGETIDWISLLMSNSHAPSNLDGAMAYINQHKRDNATPIKEIIHEL